MNLYETEALMFDPESRSGESTAADVYFFFFFVLFPSGLINVHGAFFMESLCLMKKKEKTSKERIKTHLCSIHFMLEPVDALQHQEALHMNTLIGTRRSCWEEEEGDYWQLFPVRPHFRKWLTCGTTTPLHPGRASSPAGGQSSQSSSSRC